MIDIQLEKEFFLRNEISFDFFHSPVLFSNGVILVLDQQNRKVKRINTCNNEIKILSVKGSNIGGTSTDFAISDVGFDTCIVRFKDGRREYIKMESNGRLTLAYSFMAQSFSRGRAVLFARNKNEFYGLSNTGVSTDFDLAIGSPGYEYRELIITDVYGNIIKETSVLLKIPKEVFVLSVENSVSTVPIPYLSPDRIINMNNGGFLIARPDKNMLEVYSEKSVLTKKICPDITTTTIKKDDLDEFIEKLTSFEQMGRIASLNVRKLIEKRVGIEMPPFFNVWTSGEKFLLKTDIKNSNSFELTVINNTGMVLGILQISSNNRICYFQNDRVFCVYSNPEKGQILKIYKLCFRS